MAVWPLFMPQFPGARIVDVDSVAALGENPLAVPREGDFVAIVTPREEFLAGATVGDGNRPTVCPEDSCLIRGVFDEFKCRAIFFGVPNFPPCRHIAFAPDVLFRRPQLATGHRQSFAVARQAHTGEEIPRPTDCSYFRASCEVPDPQRLFFAIEGDQP